jgi:uncharacterized protein with HEPN domain
MHSDRARQRLLDIKDNIGQARAFIGTMTFTDFASDLKTFYATVRALEIISEATRFLPEDVKARHPDVDRIAVRDAGNVYRHSYELVTEEQIWDTVMKRFGPLDEAVSAEIARPE